jgi:hypothetical protein
MAGINGISAYQRTEQAWRGEQKSKTERTEQSAAKASANSVEKTTQTYGKPVNPVASLIPRNTKEYGYTIGEVKLSDKAAEYLQQLKSKYGNMEFITVSSSLKDRVHAQASNYGMANKTVVLIDEEKLERMATDESFRKKYEGIIAMAQNKMMEAKNSLVSSGANVTNFGMKVDKDGNTSFFATVEKSQAKQKERIEKKAEEKRELKAKEKKEAQKERMEHAREKRHEERVEREHRLHDPERIRKPEQEIIEASSLEELLEKVQNYSFENASENVRAEAERQVGNFIDFKG